MGYPCRCRAVLGYLGFRVQGSGSWGPDGGGAVKAVRLQGRLQLAAWHWDDKPGRA